MEFRVLSTCSTKYLKTYQKQNNKPIKVMDILQKQFHAWKQKQITVLADVIA